MSDATKIGDVREAVVCGTKLPCVKITESEWIIRDGLKYISGADLKGGTDIFIREIGA